MNSGLLKKFGGIGVAILVALGFFAFNTIRAKAGAPEVGECVVVSGPANNVEVDTKKCGDDQVIWKVTSDDGNCDEIERNYTVEVKGSKAVDLCLDFDLAAGDCIKVTQDDSTIETPAACSEKSNRTTAIVKVASVDKASSKAKCAKNAYAYSNATRNSTICFVPAT
jgi:hypothetical protein